MYDLFFSNGAAWFSVPAFIGSAFFLLRIVMLLAGAGHHLGLDGHMDVGHDGGPDQHTDSSQDFQWLSIQSIASFAMGFGWGALGGLHGLHWDMARSALVGCAGGAGMVYLLAVVLRGMADLQTSGNIPIQSAVGDRKSTRL